jgi:hypothetical protein
MRLVGHVAQMREMRHSYESLVGKRERKIQLGRPWCREENNIKTDHE